MCIYWRHMIFWSYTSRYIDQIFYSFVSYFLSSLLCTLLLVCCTWCNHLCFGLTTVSHPEVRKKKTPLQVQVEENLVNHFTCIFRVVDVSLGRMHYEVGLCALQFTFYLKMIDLKGKLMCIKFCPTWGKTDTESWKKVGNISFVFQVKMWSKVC